MTATTKKRGRPSKKAELETFAEYAGIDPQLVGDFIGDAVPTPPEVDMAAVLEDPKQMEAWAKQMLMEHVASGKASVAMVNGLRALIDFARKQEAPPDPDAEEALPLLERAHSLPPDMAGRLIREELARLDALRDAYFQKLEELA